MRRCHVGANTTYLLDRYTVQGWLVNLILVCVRANFAVVGANREIVR